MGNAVRKNRAKGKSDLPTKPLNPLEERLTAVIKVWVPAVLVAYYVWWRGGR